MGIELSSYSPDVVEMANDKYNDRPSRKRRRVKVVVECCPYPGPFSA